jgi:hypothetical protein
VSQRVAEFAMVVNLAVEEDMAGTLLICHWLRTAGASMIDRRL